MKIKRTEAEEVFRERVSRFICQNLPEETRASIRAGRRPSRQQLSYWYGMLHQQGWATPRWSSDWGGTGWTEGEHAIFDEEVHRNGAPRMISPGILMLGPTLIKYGSDEQKARYLPGIQTSTTWWAQGFSESEAGSDLASVRTTATATVDAHGKSIYVVNGRKIWTSYAQFCDKIFCLVRTGQSGTRPQSGLSLLLVDLHSPGIGIRRLKTIDGGDDLNEVTFDAVEVHESELVGRAGEGWTYAKYLLTFERSGIAGVGAAKKLLSQLREVRQARLKMSNASKLLDFDIARLSVEILALEATAMRMSEAAASDPLTPSILKIRGTELRQELSRKIYEYSGDEPFENVSSLASESIAPRRLNSALCLLDLRKLSIYGGTNEIQRNIIAKQIFGS